jgi:hypothetical protein
LQFPTDFFQDLLGARTGCKRWGRLFGCFFADLLGLGRNAGLLFPVFFSAVGLEGFSGGSTGFVCGVSAEVSGSKAVSSGSAGFGASAGVSSATPRKSA